MTHLPTPTPTGLDLDSIYLTILNEALERRQREHGCAYLTSSEDAWLKTHSLRRTQRYADLGPFDESARVRQPTRPSRERHPGNGMRNVA